MKMRTIMAPDSGGSLSAGKSSRLASHLSCRSPLGAESMTKHTQYAQPGLRGVDTRAIDRQPGNPSVGRISTAMRGHRWPPPRIVPAFAEVEDGQARLPLGAEPLPIEQLALEHREEGLAQRVVVGAPHAGHGRPDTGPSRHRRRTTNSGTFDPNDE